MERGSGSSAGRLFERVNGRGFLSLVTDYFSRRRTTRQEYKPTREEDTLAEYKPTREEQTRDASAREELTTAEERAKTGAGSRVRRSAQTPSQQNTLCAVGRALTWKPWEGSIVSAWVCEVAKIGTNGRVVTAVLEVSARGRARLTTRIEEKGQLVAVVGSEEKRGVRTPEQGQEWAQTCLESFDGAKVRVPEPWEEVPKVSDNGPCPVQKPEVATESADRSDEQQEAPGELASRGIWLAAARAVADVSAWPLKAARSVGTGLVYHAISCNNDSAKLPPTRVNYTLHILCDVIDIKISMNVLERCE